MPDTSFINPILVDSFNLRLSTLQHAIEKHSQNPTFSIWIPLLAAIAGGLLVWIGQAIERKTKLGTERKNMLLEIYAYCRKLEAEMKNSYRELAMAKVHVEYWWHCYRIGNEDHLKPYEEHLRSQAFAREVEKNIGSTKAAFIGHVRKFQAITPLPNSIDEQLEIISDLTNPKAKSYDTSLSHHTVRYELTEKDENELRELYYQNLAIFKIINEQLRGLASRK